MVAAAKFLVAATKILFVVPNFVAVTKPFVPSWVETKLGGVVIALVISNFKLIPTVSGLVFLFFTAMFCDKVDFQT